MIVEEVIKDMLELYNEQKFAPRQEADVQCLMYHLILQHGKELPLVHANFPVEFKGSWIHPDIVLGNAENINEREIVEIKFMQESWDLQPGRITRRMETSIEDLRKLSETKCKRKFFVFFNEARPLSDKRKRRLLEFVGNHTIFILLERRNKKLVRVLI